MKIENIRVTQGLTDDNGILFIPYADVKASINKYNDKYRWHDLRKNPDDLPEHYNEVLCMTNSENKQFRYCIIRFGSYYWSKRIIAWKEIELFEEEE